MQLQYLVWARGAVVARLLCRAFPVTGDRKCDRDQESRRPGVQKALKRHSKAFKKHFSFFQERKAPKKEGFSWNKIKMDKEHGNPPESIR